MSKPVEKQTLEQAVAKIERLDLAPIRFKIACKEDGLGWTEEHAARVEQGYRRFLILLARHPALQLAPTQDIDKFWHAHILDTRKYAADCDEIFGEFVHHYPYLGLRGDLDALQDAAASLQQLFVSEFGEPVPDNARPEGERAAWCGIAPPQPEAAAWCGIAPPEPTQAAWCGIAPPGPQQAAWCGIAPPEPKAAAVH